MSNRRKAPPGCYWVGQTLYARIEVAGARLRFSLHTSNGKIAVQRREARLKLEIDAARFGMERVAYDQAFIAWATWIPDQVSEATADRYAVSLRQLAPFLRPLYLDQLTIRKIGELVTERRKVAQVATVRRDLTALSSLLGFAELEGWIESNPALSWQRRLRERREPIVLPAAANIDAVIERAPGMLSELVRIALATGCRLDELVSAKRSQFNAERRELTVHGKGNKVRTIELDHFGGFELVKKLPTFLGSQWLFWHGQGAPYRNFSSRFSLLVGAEEAAQKKLLADPAACAFRKFRFHDLRHLHAVQWLQSGRSIYALQRRLGHASIKTTEIYLAYVTPEQARIAMDAGIKAAP